jgi:hypothetical protein
MLLAACLTLLLCLAPAAAALPTLHPGDQGKSVQRLQRALGLAPDGIFGSGTRKALRRFQRRHDLTADGIAGASTWRMLRRSGRVASRNNRTARPKRSVTLLQRRLGIGADGIFGPGTQRAVRRFQRSRGLTADGIVGAATWSALGVRGSRPVLRRARLRGRERSAAGGLPLAVARAIAAGNRIARRPYRYGGGHGSFSDSGYDCSGSISYVLHGGGLLGRPLDSSQFMRWGSPGPGRWITIYAHAGHAYMVIRTRSGLLRYDTSGMDDGSRWDGDLRSSAGYVVRHPPGL